VETDLSDSIHGLSRGRRSNQGRSIGNVDAFNRPQLSGGCDTGMICPACSSTQFKESRQCPRHSGEPVCISCCRRCEYYNPKVSALKCRYYIYHPKIDYDAEIEKIDRQIRHKMNQIEHFYNKSMPRVAEKIELEVICLGNQKRELEHKKRVTEAGNPTCLR